MRLNGVDFTVVGVVPASFFGTVPGRWADFYVPACLISRVFTDFARETPLTSDRFWWLQLFVGHGRRRRLLPCRPRSAPSSRRW